MSPVVEVAAPLVEPPQERSLLELDPAVIPAAGEWLRLCAAGGVPVLVYETRRSLERQAWLYASGRTRPGPIVTLARPGESNHHGGRALDAAPWEVIRLYGSPVSKLDWDPFVTAEHGKAWKAQIKAGLPGDLSLLDDRWRVIVQAAGEVGLSWAGRWTKFQEYVHFEAVE